MKTPILPLISLAILLTIGLSHCIATSWAQDIPIPAARPKAGKFLPPPEFDRPYPGTLAITVLENGDRIRAACPEANFTITPIACNIRHGMVLCKVFVLPDNVIRALGYDPDVVRRHEIGHCNGWPGHHPGAR